VRELLTEMAVELGEEDPKVSLDHFVRLFVNHRSVFDIERTNFEEVFHFPPCMQLHSLRSFFVSGVRNSRNYWEQLAAQSATYRSACWRWGENVQGRNQRVYCHHQQVRFLFFFTKCTHHFQHQWLGRFKAWTNCLQS
jgi:hypothetical protein